MSSSRPLPPSPAHDTSSSSLSPAYMPAKSVSQTRKTRTRPGFLAILAIRLINAWCISTFFQPDEFFQALEPAWSIAFGQQSRPWLTWEWHWQLRSSLHPALFSLAYLLAGKLSSFLPVSLRTVVVMAAPKALQALIAALGDWYTWRLAADIYGPDADHAVVVLLLQLLSPWQWYVSTRTFSNSLETTLTVMALYYWPWQLLGLASTVKENTKRRNLLVHPWRLRTSFCLAALAVVLRPTNVLIWATVVALALTRLSLKGPSPLSKSYVAALFRDAVLCGGLVITLSLVADRLYFGFWTFPPLNWLNFNISKSLAVFYGRNPWHYYLLQGVPLLCTTSLPFALWGLVKPAASSAAQENTLKTLSYTALTTLGALSLISHKEVRFIYPLLPTLNILAAPRVAAFFTSAAPASAKSRPRLRNKPFLVAALAVNVCLAGYLSLFHQAAPLAVLSHLRGQYERIHPAPTARFVHAAPGDSDELFALFLTPCHSTPWRSHLVYPGLRAYALSCEPPLHTKAGSPERAAYRDEADRFYDDPLHFLRAELFGPGGLRAPRYIVGFEGIEPWLRSFLETDEAAALGLARLAKVWAGFNGLFTDDWRRAGKLVVWDTGVYDDASANRNAAA